MSKAAFGMILFNKKPKSLTSKFRYPLSLHPGQAVGFFEMLFNNKSKYIYKVGAE